MTAPLFDRVTMPVTCHELLVRRQSHKRVFTGNDGVVTCLFTEHSAISRVFGSLLGIVPDTKRITTIYNGVECSLERHRVIVGEIEITSDGYSDEYLHKLLDRLAGQSR